MSTSEKIVNDYQEKLSPMGFGFGLTSRLGNVGAVDYAFNKYYANKIMTFKSMDGFYFSYEPDMKLMQENVKKGPWLQSGTLTIYIPEDIEKFISGYGEEVGNIGFFFRRLLALLLGLAEFKGISVKAKNINDIKFSKITKTYPDGKEETIDTIDILGEKYRFIKKRFQMSYEDYASLMLEKDFNNLVIIDEDIYTTADSGDDIADTIK